MFRFHKQIQIAFAALTLAVPAVAQKTIPVKSLGTRSLIATPAGTAGSGAIDLSKELRREPDDELAQFKAGFGGQARVPASGVPSAASNSIASVNPGMIAFDGLNHADQRLAGGGNQFSLEPPDQGLAVGAGYVVEAINTALAVYNASGSRLTAPVTLSAFFGLAAEIDRNANPTVYGPFLSDPRCYYDSQTGRFYVTLLEIDVNPATGDLTNHSHVLIAVSTTSDPTAAWNLYQIDTTNDGTASTPSHPGCPCFGDQPLMGADANALVVTTNEFPIVGAGFNGSQVYAMSKTSLAAGTLGSVILFDNLPLAEGPAYSLQPATTPPGGTFETAAGGTEYMLSALDFNGTRDNRIAVWALSNTSSLNTATPAVTLTSRVLASEVYGQPPAAVQPDGYRPLAQIWESSLLGIKTPPIEKAPLLDTNDDRMNQVVFAGGKLWGAVNTILKPSNGPTSTGIAWFAVTPSIGTGGLSGAVAAQGYVAVSKATVMFPAIGMNKNGKGIITFTLVGPNYLPSAAYAPIDINGAGDIHIALAGAGPDDGFTGYALAGKPTRGTGRWGDYSAAVADANGDIWIATEYITPDPRTVLANWGTAIARVTP